MEFMLLLVEVQVAKISSQFQQLLTNSTQLIFDEDPTKRYPVPISIDLAIHKKLTIADSK